MTFPLIYDDTIIYKPKDKWYFKEIITLRVASKDLVCYECPSMLFNEKNEVFGTIKKGEKYIRDKFLYINDWGQFKTKVNFICLKCWNGIIPKKVACNTKTCPNCGVSNPRARVFCWSCGFRLVESYG